MASLLLLSMSMVMSEPALALAMAVAMSLCELVEPVGEMVLVELRRRCG